MQSHAEPCRPRTQAIQQKYTRWFCHGRQTLFHTLPMLCLVLIPRRKYAEIVATLEMRNGAAPIPWPAHCRSSPGGFSTVDQANVKRSLPGDLSYVFLRFSSNKSNAHRCTVGVVSFVATGARMKNHQQVFPSAGFHLKFHPSLGLQLFCPGSPRLQLTCHLQN